MSAKHEIGSRSHKLLRRHSRSPTGKRSDKLMGNGSLSLVVGCRSAGAARLKKKKTKRGKSLTAAQFRRQRRKWPSWNRDPEAAPAANGEPRNYRVPCSPDHPEVRIIDRSESAMTTSPIYQRPATKAEFDAYMK